MRRPVGDRAAGEDQIVAGCCQVRPYRPILLEGVMSMRSDVKSVYYSCDRDSVRVRCQSDLQSVFSESPWRGPAEGRA